MLYTGHKKLPEVKVYIRLFKTCNVVYLYKFDAHIVGEEKKVRHVYVVLCLISEGLFIHFRKLFIHKILDFIYGFQKMLDISTILLIVLVLKKDQKKSTKKYKHNKDA